MPRTPTFENMRPDAPSYPARDFARGDAGGNGRPAPGGVPGENTGAGGVRGDGRMPGLPDVPGDGAATPDVMAAMPGGPPGPPGGPGGPFGGPVQRAENVGSTLRRMARYFSAEALLTGLMLLVVAVSTLSSIVAPAYQSAAVDVIAGTSDAEFLPALVGMLGFYLLYALCQFGEGFISAHLSQRIVSRMRVELFGHVVDLPVGYLDAHSNGDVMSRMTNDIDNISNTVSKSLSSMFSSVLTIVGTAAVMLWFCWQLALICFATVGLTLAATKLLAAQVRRYSRDRQRLLGQVNGMVEETVAGYRTVMAYNRQDRCMADFERTSDALTEAGIRCEAFAGSMGPVMNGIGNIGFVVVVAFGGLFALQGLVSVGVISAFIIYMKQFSRPVSDLAQIYGQLQSAVASAERVFSVLDEKAEDCSGAPLAPVVDHAGVAGAARTPAGVADTLPVSGGAEVAPGGAPPAGSAASVVFDHVTFGYDPDQPVLRDFSLEVPAGKKVALVGHTGSGKTTVANLLMRFYDPQGGRILVNGQDIAGVARPSLRAHCSIVLQEATLFGDTVAANLTYANPDASAEQVGAALRASRCEDFVTALSEGLDTRLAQAGENVSAGQRQLLTIARAFVADPDVLVLDEATSNVDTRTEAEIQVAMQRIMRDRTSLVIAHRLSTIRDADLIVVLDHGRIAERGTHDELLAAGGAYAELYRAQFAGLAT